MIIAKYLSDLWSTVAPAVGNHLWQSTLFAIVAGLLTLALKKNQARARYWLWLAASLKFLIPFSLLVGAGSYLGWSRTTDGVETGFTFAMDQFSQPFSQPTLPVRSHAGPAVASPLASLSHLLPVFLAALWLCGFAAVLFTWLVRWRRMCAAMREATPLHEGREVNTPRRLERAGGIRKRIGIFLSRASLEPGIFGIARPALIWPEGISERLDDAHVDAILAHEVGHVKRRDNLFAAVHMLVEAIFWFHPLVWFVGTRLVEEREVACDEEVLELGSERQVYAESILKICEFCVGSQLVCVSGVTGADLKRRMVRIMTHGSARGLNFSKKLLLIAAGMTAIAAPVAFGLAHAAPHRDPSQNTSAGAPKYEYEVATIKPSKRVNGAGVKVAARMQAWVGAMNSDDAFTAPNVTAQMLISSAYGVQNYQIAGAPSWLNSDTYDFEAKIESSVADALQKLSPGERILARQQMLQALLADRFKLSIHREMKELPVYMLVIAKNGSKLSEAKPGDTYPNGLKGPDGKGAGAMGMGSDAGALTMIAQAVPIANLIRTLAGLLGRPVLDRTGLTGIYDFKLTYMPDEGRMQDPLGGSSNSASGLPSTDSGGTTLFTAVQEQLGLRLESGKGPVEAIVIDHVEKPSGN